jgi:hypothetical protein
MKYLLNRKLFELFELIDKKVRNYSLFDKFLNPYLNPSLVRTGRIFSLVFDVIKCFSKLVIFQTFSSFSWIFPKISNLSKFQKIPKIEAFVTKKYWSKLYFIPKWVLKSSNFPTNHQSFSRAFNFNTFN